jgi:hypothetical protein
MTKEDEDSAGDGGEAREDDPIAGMYDDSTEQEPVVPTKPGETEDDDGGLSGPLAEEPEEPETKRGTYYVKYAEDSAVTLHDVETAEICQLIENPGFQDHEIVEATLMAQPPMEVSYVVKELHDQYAVDVDIISEPPTTQTLEIAEQMDEDEVIAFEREGEGEIHVLKLDSDSVESTVGVLDEDEQPYKNAARNGVDRVEIRSDADAGVIAIRYLP